MNNSHIKQFVDMLASIGYDSEIEMHNNRLVITLESNNKNVHGYMGFVCYFEFNIDGNLNNIGIYE